jgi:hypothetical protein
MSFFKERTTPTQNVAFLSLMAAVNALLAVLLAFAPLSDLFVVLVLPLVSAMVGLLCQKQYLPIYVIAAIGVSLATSAYNMQATFFYVIPAILSGTLYGFLYHSKQPLPYLILYTALLELGMMALSILIIKGIYENDIIAFFLQVLGLADHPYIHDIVPAFLLTYALAQTAISHFVIQGFFSRFHLEEKSNEKLLLSYPIGGIGAVVLALSFIVYSPATSYFFLVLALYLTAFSSLLFVTKFAWWVYLVLGVMELLSLYGFASLYSLVPADGGLVLLSFFLFSLDTATLLGRLLLLRKKKERID